MTTSDEDVPADVYVAVSGDDVSTNPCTAIDAPCLTVSGALTRARTLTTDDGEVVVGIAAGTYNENVIIGSVASGHSLSLVGAGPSSTIIHGLGTASVINITSGTVNLSGLSITGGHAVSGGGIYNGAGVLTVAGSTVSGNTGTGSGAAQGGGGIYNNTGTLTVAHSTVSGNTATGLNTLAGGGGLYNNAGTLTVADSTVSDNASTTGYAGGIFNNTGTLSVSDSTLSDNAGWYVGGIHNRGTLSVSRSTVSDNLATKNFGGGISNFGGTMTLTDSTLSGNAATFLNTGQGGAIYNKGVATITNATLAGNAAYQGGGIYTQSRLLTVSNSTLSSNTQTYTGGAGGAGGGIWAASSPYVNLRGSILSGSSCNQKYAAVDGGYNVNADSSCFTTIGPTSIQGSTTIGLAPLAANGSTGPQTMAIDSTSSAHHLVPTCTGTDGRALGRPGFGAAANCDAGAYELQAAAPTVTTDPQSQSVVIGSDATFTAAASGTPSPTVTWQANTGSAWTDVPDATTTTLTVTDMTHAMSGNQYRAVFANGVGPDATTAVATLTVPVGPLDHLAVSPASGTVVVGGSQTFTAEGFDSSGNSLGDVTGATVFTGSAGMRCTAATCTSSVPGAYTVIGTNGAATGAASLTVTAAPAVGPPITVPGPPIVVPTTPAPPGSPPGGGPPNAPGVVLPSGEVIDLRDGHLSITPRAAPPGVDVVAGAVTPTGQGAWSVSATGEVFTTGDARPLGGTSGRQLNAPIVGVAPTPSGDGYWLIASDGGIFSFGDAPFFGSTASTPLNQPVVGLASTPTGRGYWLVAGDGGVFTFGDARFFGSTDGMHLQAPVIAMAPTPDASGYWLLGADGGVFTFGDARFFGSTGGNPRVGRIVAMVPTASGDGYWLAGANRQVYGFGDA